MAGFGNPKREKNKRETTKREIKGQELHQKALLNHANGELRKAEELYRNAIKTGYLNHKVFSNLGVICKNSGRKEEAIALYKKAIKIKPNYKDAYINLCNVYQELEMHEDRLYYTLKLFDLEADNPNTLINLGGAYKEIGNLSLALKYTQKAYELNPNNYIVLMNLGGIHKSLGNLDLALEYTSKSLKINPNNSISHMNMGGIYKDLGNLPLALAYTNKSLELDPHNPGSQINAGEIYQDMGNGEQALIFLKKALKNVSTEEDASIRIATIYYYSKNYAAGIEVLKDINSKKGKSTLLSLYLCANDKENFNSCANEITKKKWHTQQTIAAIDHANIIYGQHLSNGLNDNTINSIINKKVSSNEFPDSLLEEAITYVSRKEINSRTQGHLINGEQTSGNILEIPLTAFVELKKLFIRRIAEYNKICSIATDKDFINNWDKGKYQLNGWAIIMKQGGSLTAHNHESGWLTGTFYLQMPEISNSIDEGGIEFSHEGPNYPKGKAKFATKTLRPKVRDLNIFASSLFHRTIPFSSTKKRICIAFDIRESR